MAKTYWIVWNGPHKHEGSLFGTKRDADSALDGMPRPDPDLGGLRTISTLAEAFYNTYGEDGEAWIEEVTLGAVVVKAGKFYRDANGNKQGPMWDYGTDDGFPFSVEDQDSPWWSPDGKVQPDCIFPGVDLVEEWTE